MGWKEKDIERFGVYVNIFDPLSKRQQHQIWLLERRTFPSFSFYYNRRTNILLIHFF